MLFIISVLIVAYIVITIVSSTIMNKGYILSKLDEANYYNRIYELAVSNFGKYIQQSGVDENIVRNAITEEKVKQDTEQILINLYDGINEEISTKEIEDKLKVGINTSAGRTLSAEEQKAVDTFITKICDEYKATIANTKYEVKFNKNYLKIKKYIKLFNKLALVAIGVCSILVLALNIRKIYRAVNKIGIALLASGSILTLINIYINVKIKISGITILNDVISDVIRNVANEIITKIGICGVGFVVVGIVSIIGSNLLHYMKKHGTKV